MISRAMAEAGEREWRNDLTNNFQNNSISSIPYQRLASDLVAYLKILLEKPDKTLKKGFIFKETYPSYEESQKISERIVAIYNLVKDKELEHKHLLRKLNFNVRRGRAKVSQIIEILSLFRK